MTRTRVKICGITRPEDAVAAARLGADAIGLVFYPRSPRAVTPAQARAVLDVLPPFVTSVGLFVDEAPEQIEAVLREVPLDLLQFHGDESPEACARFGRPWIKALRMRAEIDLPCEAERYGEARALLLDAYHPSAPGGTGEVFDWGRIPHDLPLPIILAGGLGPDNVGRAIAEVSPYAVDVSSGVEAAKGIKDRDRMTALMREVELASRRREQS